MLAAAGGRSDGVALLRPIRAQGDDAASLRNRAAAEFGAAANLERKMMILADARAKAQAQKKRRVVATLADLEG